PADGQVLERVAQEPEDLVAVTLRRDQVALVFDGLVEPRLVLRHLEEVVLLLDPRERRLVVRALAVDDLLLGVEAFAAEAVLPAVLAEVELALVPQGLEERLDDLRLARLGRPDVVVVVDPELAPRVPERRRVAVGELLGGHPGGGGGLRELGAVAVGT